MQGFNMGRWVPPELEGLTSGNAIHSKKPPGFHGGKQTVRFEMPFNIFCLKCDGHIAQGVRFNAEKKKVGNYYSTSIFAFRMKHNICQNWIEITTDPKNTAYVVTEGGKKKAADDEPVGIFKVNEAPVAPAPGIPEDPFARQEKNVKDKTETKMGAARIAELKGLSDRQWADPYEHSRKLRKVFRAERKVLAEKAAAREAICDRVGLSIKLLDEAPEDAMRAKLIDFGPGYEEKISQAQSRPLFEKEPEQPLKSTRAKGKLKSQFVVEQTKEALQKDLVRNTRAAVDPFLQFDRPRQTLGIKINKRKAIDVSLEDGSGSELQNVEAAAGEQANVVEKSLDAQKKQKPQMSLGLDYDSD